MNKSERARAYKEGWAIFEASGSQCNEQGNWPYQLQADFEGPLGNDDPAAHRLVIDGATEGKKHCVSALKFLRRESKPELDLILRGYLSPDVSWKDSILTNDKKIDQLEIDIFGKVVSRD